MNKMYQEIDEITQAGKDFLENSPTYELPLNVPYLGMGSSYFAPLSFKYMGIHIYPEMASEYFNYLSNGIKLSNAVILSQSGKSSEALWCTSLCEKYVAITNNLSGPLATSNNVAEIVDLLAGDEQYSSSKTYTNTLLALFKGFGFNTANAFGLLVGNIKKYETVGQKLAEEVYHLITTKKIHGIYIIGSGPNIGTALQAALIMSESTKLCFTGMSMAQYDHGPKETAADSIVIQIVSKGKSYTRSQNLTATLTKAGTSVFTIEEPDVDENFSILHNIVPFSYMAYYLAEKLNIKDTFLVGGKVTEVI